MIMRREWLPTLFFRCGSQIMVKEVVLSLIEQAAEELGYLIYDCAIMPRGENTRISVAIDSYDGISHEDCARFDHLFSKKLDQADIFKNYSLEVSSPGLNRRLENVEEFRRFISSPVKIVYIKDNNTDVVKGLLLDADEQKVTVSSENKLIEITLPGIKKANLDY